MTHTEAADLILQAANKWDIERVQKSYFDFVAAVATVMDAARADAVEESARHVKHLLGVIEDAADNFDNGDGSSFYLRDALAQSHREPKP